MPALKQYGLRVDQLKRLDKCVKDDKGQPLPCYGCKGAAVSNDDPTLTVIYPAEFPGINVEWVCLHCIRNPERELFWKENGGEPARAESQKAYRIIKSPSDLYCTMDAFEQNIIWKL